MIQENNRYKIQENKLLIGNVEIVFDYPVDYCVEIADMLILLLEIPVKVEYNENVFGVSLSEQKIMWQIEKKKYELQKYTNLHCKYSGITIFENSLILNNWCDAYLIVDPLTGKILKEGVSR
jgi:hypothetical protein